MQALRPWCGGEWIQKCNAVEGFGESHKSKLRLKKLPAKTLGLCSFTNWSHSSLHFLSLNAPGSGMSIGATHVTAFPETDMRADYQGTGCISCTPSTPRASASTPSRKFKLAKSQSLHILQDSRQTTSTPGMWGLAKLYSGQWKCDCCLCGRHGRHRVTLKKRYGLLLTQQST